MRTRNESHKVEGFVLKRISYKDADKIITIFTKELGKITCLAKGIRKIESKRKSHLEPLNRVELFLIKIGDWYLITHAKSIDTYSNIKANITNLHYAIAILEVSNKLLNDNEVDLHFYNVLSKTVNAINKEPSIRILNSFLVQILKVAGIYERAKCFEMSKYIINVKNDDIKESILFYENTPIENITNKIQPKNDDLNYDWIDTATLKTLILYLEYAAEIKLKTPLI